MVRSVASGREAFYVFAGKRSSSIGSMDFTLSVCRNANVGSTPEIYCVRNETHDLGFNKPSR